MNWPKSDYEKMRESRDFWKCMTFGLLVLLFVLTAVRCKAGEYPNAIQYRTIAVSNVTYTIRYELKSTNSFMRPLTNPIGQPHYDCTATIWNGTSRLGILPTQWTERGCFEDDPMMLVGRTLAWKCFPPDSAGKGMHWVISGEAQYREPNH